MFHKMEPKEWKAVIDVHLNGTFFVRAIHRDGGWTPQALAERIPQAFKTSFTPLERTMDVFCWDPI